MHRDPAERGFTIMEVVVATLVLTIGMVSLLALFSQTAVVMNFAQEDLLAKQKARESLESIYTARNTQQITFTMIQNVSAGGIFLDGWQSLRTAGADGLIGTVDDGAVEQLRLPGPDGLLGTADDVIRSLNNFSRQIEVTPVVIAGSNSNDIRRITIRVRYVTTKGARRSYEVQSYVSRFR